MSSHSSSDGHSHAKSRHSAGGGSILGRKLGSSRNDPIALAKNRVLAAEKAEIAADRALAVSKKEVLEARSAVERVEKDLRAKQMAVREVSARGRGLGRHS
uniref:Uncharacterized protein n=1 Tax=Bionectria ochroleuca TaxID=29856 RepID=A0A0B7KP18_BIOOC